MTPSHESARKRVHINNVSFNSDASFFTVAMEEGLRVYQTDALELHQCLGHGEGGELRIAKQLDSSCVVAMSGMTPNTKIPSNQAKLYNFITNNFGAAFTLPNEIRNILLRDDKIVLVQPRFVNVYDLSMFPLKDIKKNDSYNTCDNTNGLCQMSHNHATRHILCYPGVDNRTVKIVGMSLQRSMQSSPATINAHQHKLAYMKLSDDGMLLATCSESGTLIRIWCTKKYNQLMEFRRGMDTAKIYDIAFSPDKQFLACVSDKKTVHIFSLTNAKLNVTSNLSSLASSTSSSTAQTSMTQFSISNLVDCRIAIKSSGFVYVVTLDGRYFKYQFPRDGSSYNCMRVSYELYCDMWLEQEVTDTSTTSAADDHCASANTTMDAGTGIAEAVSTEGA